MISTIHSEAFILNVVRQCEHKLCAGAHCDPWVSVQVNRDRRSLRRRPPSPITQFRTKVIL